MDNAILQGDCLDLMRKMGPASVDLVFCSPPYEDCRTYGIDFKLKGQDWVDWCVERYVECLRVSKGLVAWVVEGKTRQFRWSATPVLLMADLHRAGVHLRKPPAFHRLGIPGSGGPDFWRNDYEFIICATKGGRLPWSDNTATGKPCKCPPGGAMSYRRADGRRRTQVYVLPKKANAGNVLHCKVGGGKMGSKLAHENEAPFPESLVRPFVQCFCPPGGIVLDPFGGSGTTAAVAIQEGRHFITMDVRQSQVNLCGRRVAENCPLFV